ncbi:CDP-glycerol glycerophosphotransferase family protein [Selenomonas sp. AB3002]|uniref:CDP-glycerol glycerophosphotransferase family protein n=1 Tax=Selenomonas sp. AB3002 TaxID=1392502 RepID=UPI000497A32D
MTVEILPDRFYVYGAGHYARIFMSWLQMNKMENRVKGIVVTDKAEGETVFCGCRVYGLQDIKTYLNREMVYIAVSQDISHGIINELDMLGAENIQLTDLDFEDMEADLFAFFSEEGKLYNQIVVWNFWGMGYYDQCKYIIEEVHKRDKDIKVYWVLKEENTALPEWIEPIIIGSYEYYMVMSRSRLLVTNVNSPSSCKFKQKNQYYIYTWHGMGPSKRLEWDSPLHRAKAGNDKEVVKRRWSGADVMIAGSNFCHEVYRNSFLYDGVIEDWGYPRNDIFFKGVSFEDAIKDRYNIGKEKKIILYAPTFRNELMESRDTDRLQEIYDIDLSLIREAAEKRFASEFVVMYRFHNYVYRYVDISSYQQNGIDVTYYPDMQELLSAIDILVTDYSSSMWDFSLKRKPVFLYYHDAEEYEEKYQGFYVFPDNYPYPKGHTTEELCNEILAFDGDVYQKRLDEWFGKYGTYDDGHASERVAGRILDVMKNPAKYGKG